MQAPRKAWFSLAATLVVLGLAYGPLLAQFFANQWRRPQYQYFPFVLAAFAWLLWRGCASARPRTNRNRFSRIELVSLLVLAWGTLALAYAANSPWLAVVSAILLVASRLASLEQAWRVEYLWGIWALLWLMVPLPMNRDQHLVNGLQHASSRFSSLLLDSTGVRHLMEGNVLLLPDKEFFVDEACSGIVSVLSVITCSVIYGVWRNRPPLHVLLLALASIVLATLLNVARISAIAIVYDAWGIDWSAGLAHEMLGLVVFAFIFLALVSTDYWLAAVLEPIIRNEDGEFGEPLHFGATLVSCWDHALRWGAPGPAPIVAQPAPTAGRRLEVASRFALGVVALLAFGTLASAQRARQFLLADAPSNNSTGIDRAIALDAPALASRLGRFQQTNFSRHERHREDIFGQYSRTYVFQDEHGNEYAVSCDFPFGPPWHDLTTCYHGIGWMLREAPTVRSATSSRNSPWDYVEANFTKPDGAASLLVYCVFDGSGEAIAPPRHSFSSDLWRSLSRQKNATRPEPLFQIQVWTTAAGAVSERRTEAARELLLAVREQFRSLIADNQSATQSQLARPVE